MNHMDFTENGRDFRLFRQGPDLSCPEGTMVVLYERTSPEYTKLFDRVAGAGDDIEKIVNEAKQIAKSSDSELR